MAIKVNGTTVIDDSANITSSVGGFKTVGGVDITGSGNIDAAPSTNANAVGTYAFLYAGVHNTATGGSNWNFNATFSGSQLDWSNGGGLGRNDGGTQPAGTWRLMGCLGYYNGSYHNSSEYMNSVFVRIS
jgi:hypothetical protein